MAHLAIRAGQHLEAVLRGQVPGAHVPVLAARQQHVLALHECLHTTPGTLRVKPRADAAVSHGRLAMWTKQHMEAALELQMRMCPSLLFMSGTFLQN